jgi:hypothetical protein
MAEPFRVEIDDDLLQKIVKQVVNQDVKERIIHDGVEYGVFQEFSIGGRGHPSLMPAYERRLAKIDRAGYRAGRPLG